MTAKDFFFGDGKCGAFEGAQVFSKGPHEDHMVHVRGICVLGLGEEQGMYGTDQEQQTVLPFQPRLEYS